MRGPRRQLAGALSGLGLGVGLGACAVGTTTVDDGLTPDIGTAGGDAGAGGDAPAPGIDGSLTTDTAPPDPSDSSPPPDARNGDGAVADTAPPPDSSGGCASAGFTGALATFDLSGLSGSETTAPATATATGVTAGALARGGTLQAVAGLGSINSSNWPTPLDTSHYYTFFVTPPSGCTVALTALNVDLKASSLGPSSVDVATSADGYAGHHTVAATSVSNVALAGASGTSTVTLRMFGYGATSTGGTLRIQNTMTLSGTLN